MPAIKTYLVGRSPDCDIVLGDSTISRKHAELVEGADGRFYLTDRESAAGTWIRRSSEWQRLRQAFVGADEPIMLGRYATTVNALLKLLAQRSQAASGVAPESELPAGGVMRNPQTGEIVRKV
ncbi:MAG: FHA domain-containing protein [Reyranellaceae bacterium]